MTTKALKVENNFNSMLVSVLAHDLRQPFASFIMAIDAIKYTKRILSQEDLHLLLEDLRVTASESIELLDGLLYWMKSQKTGASNQSQHLQLNNLIQEANSLFQFDQLDKNISIYNIIPEGQSIYAHKQMLQFINRNILSNATKHSPYGGSIGITCSTEDDWITVAFTDQGTGISSERLESLFSINDTTDDGEYKLKGSGIALSICRDMIGQMNGKLWAESLPNTGSTFYYTLPLTAQL
jgi:K+-sensing histidine kinase KdpD